MLRYYMKRALKYYFVLSLKDSRNNLISRQKLFGIEEAVNHFLMRKGRNLQKVHHEWLKLQLPLHDVLPHLSMEIGRRIPLQLNVAIRKLQAFVQDVILFVG